MKKLLTILLAFAVASVFAESREYTLKKTLSDGDGSSTYSYYQFPVTSFVNDTIAYGDTVTFNLYVDYNKHVPVAPVLFMLFREAGTTDSLKVTNVINYSQAAALANDNLGALEPYYYKVFKTTVNVVDFSDTFYYPLLAADSITAAGLAYPSFSMTRSVKYSITVIPLKAGAAVKVKDFRVKVYLQPSQFK